MIWEMQPIRRRPGAQQVSPVFYIWIDRRLGKSKRVKPRFRWFRI
jgi:hypothetical protein